MVEWLKAAVLKTVERKLRGFESYSLRHYCGCSGSLSDQNRWVSMWQPVPPDRVLDRLVSGIVFGSPQYGEMAESAEGARLLSECGGKPPPRVRIPLSPPFPRMCHPDSGLGVSRPLLFQPVDLFLGLEVFFGGDPQALGQHFGEAAENEITEHISVFSG